MILILAAVLGPVSAGAEILKVAPSEAVVLPADGSGTSRVLLRFDLSGLREGVGRRIDAAVLDWPVAGVASDRLTEYTLHAVTGAWTAAGVAAGAVPAYDDEPADLWDFSPRDFENNGGGLLRFHLDGLVRDWLAGNAGNFGVVIATEDLAPAALSARLGAPSLTILYGFVR